MVHLAILKEKEFINTSSLLVDRKTINEINMIDCFICRNEVMICIHFF